MSEMEIFYGICQKSNLDLEPEDTDEFYAIEDQLKKHFVKVDGQLYEFHEVERLDADGFYLVIPPSDETRFIAHWYNGGAGIHEIVEGLIKNGSLG